MAVRQCTACEELMQEGLLVENTETGQMYYYCDECSSESTFEEELKNLGSHFHTEYVDWQQHEMDEEDFTLLMNQLLGNPSPQEVADVLDMLNREDASYYGPEGVLNQFITFLNGQEDYV